MNATPGPVARLIARTAAVGFIGIASVLPGHANVVKCSDVDGNITYQDVPCERGQAGRAVSLPEAEARNDAGVWEAAAKNARVVPGMPKRWVLRARGTPAEIRPASAREQASEVWRYSGRDGVTLVGFAGPDVAWVREDVSGREAEPRVKTTPAEPSVSGAQNRRFVIAGRYCEHVYAEIGPPDRQEPLDGPGGATSRNVRNFYEPRAGDPQMRTVFTCVAGKVVDVERTVLR